NAAIDAPDPLGTRDEERRIARLIVARDADDRAAANQPPASSGRPVNAVAEAEARRIAELRRAGAVSGARPSEEVLPMLVARRSRTRRALGRDVLLLWRIVAENAAGAIIAERVAPVRVRGCGPRLRGSGAQFRSWIDGLAAAVRPRIAAATAPWRDESADADAAFRSTRLGRERAIANRAGSTQPPAYQA